MDRVPPMAGDDDRALIEALGIAQRLGVIGDTDLVDEVRHARGFVAALSGLSTGSSVIDIGSGGGLPGLVVANDRPDLAVTLVDRRQKRTDILQRQVGRLRRDMAGAHITVLCADVDVMDIPAGGYAAVTARSFGPPSLTATHAHRLLAPDGLLVVSDPPSGDAHQRWTDELLAQLRFDRLTSPDGHPRISVLRRT